MKSSLAWDVRDIPCQAFFQQHHGPFMCLQPLTIPSQSLAFLLCADLRRAMGYRIGGPWGSAPPDAAKKRLQARKNRGTIVSRRASRGERPIARMRIAS